MIFISLNMDIVDEQLVFTQPISLEDMIPKAPRLSVLRLDAVHSVVSGNKWYKLRFHLNEAVASGATALATFGGLYSNHLVATAYAARSRNLKAVGIVRGYLSDKQMTPTLASCQSLGMRLIGFPRDQYRDRAHLESRSSLERWLEEETASASVYIIPEGGADSIGCAGASTIAAFIPATVSHVALAVGSGTTIAGLRNVLPGEVSMYGFVPFRDAGSVAANLPIQLPADKPLIFDNRYHFGGFAKHKPLLFKFMNQMWRQYQLPLDIVYTGKMFYGLLSLIREGAFPASAHVMAIHTGGLQGNEAIRRHLCY